MKTQFCWHIHHNVLLEPLTESIENRIDFIKNNKPKEEIELRLKLLKPVKGKLPKEVIKAWQAYYKAWQAYYKAWQAHVKAQQAYYKAWQAHVKAWQAHNEALEAYNNTLIKYKIEIEIEKLHSKECPNCPWDGESIFNYE